MFSGEELDRSRDAVGQGVGVSGKVVSALQRCSFSIAGQEHVAARKNKRRTSEDCMAVLLERTRGELLRIARR